MALASTGSSPVSSIMNYSSYSYVINHVNLTLGSKKPQTTIKYSTKNYSLIYLLYKLGCINNFYIHSTKKKNLLLKYLTFSIFFYKNSPFFKQIKLVSSLSKKHTITYQSLKILNQSLGNSFLILSTVQGLLTHQEALLKKIGGLILAEIN